ncbi:hypothetical protein BP354E_0541 [Burkholderia pseudomallei 354e]|nr:hypothetical protein BP354E_0541 [Burkholderia pseudomallei 354e]EIF82249.1 hypothetical protein BP354A_0559 [Burkholderia pseudomallei 354a]
MKRMISSARFAGNATVMRRALQAFSPCTASAHGTIYPPEFPVRHTGINSRIKSASVMPIARDAPCVPSRQARPYARPGGRAHCFPRKNNPSLDFRLIAHRVCD